MAPCDNRLQNEMTTFNMNCQLVICYEPFIVSSLFFSAFTLANTCHLSWLQKVFYRSFSVWPSFHLSLPSYLSVHLSICISSSTNPSVHPLLFYTISQTISVRSVSLSVGLNPCVFLLFNCSLFLFFSHRFLQFCPFITAWRNRYQNLFPNHTWKLKKKHILKYHHIAGITVFTFVTQDFFCILPL